MPLYSFSRGFSSSPREEKSNSKKQHKFKEELNFLKIRKTRSVKKSGNRSKKGKFVKRGSGKKSLQSVPIFSANCAGCNNKINSLVDNISHIRSWHIYTPGDTFQEKG